MNRLGYLLLPVAALAAPASATQTPQAQVESLLAAEREFSRGAAELSPVDGLAAMFDEQVAMPTREGWVTGREAVLASLRTNPNFQGQHVQWRPIRAGVSADGQHGFTFGYADVAGLAPERAGRRYLAYWIRRPQGWRVAVYRQLVRTPQETLLEALPPSLPAPTTPPATGASTDHARSLAAAEQAFSDRAQQVGLRAAFTEFGSPDAMNMGGPTGFRIGNQVIGGGFPDERTSPVAWSADRTLVASSGDLGVTIGTIRPNGPVQEGRPASIPFFTIWRRDDSAQPWRYIAE